MSPREQLLAARTLTMTPETKAMLAGLIRHGLTTAGGALVTDGWVSSDQLNTGIGAIIALLGIGWSIYQKRKAKPVQAGQ